MKRMQATARQFSLLAYLAGGLVIACSEQSTGPTGPTNPDAIYYTAIGGSDAVGVGGSVLCGGTLTCPNGTGYVYLLERQLRATGKTVTLTNVGVPGTVLSPAIMTLARQAGRGDIPANFLDNQVPFVAPETTHVTVFAGGNDTNVIVQAVRAGLVGSDTPNDIRAYVDRQVDQWGLDFAELVRRLRARAPAARIVAYNVPNLGAFPYVARSTAQERSLVQRIAVGMADRINAAVAQNALVVDLMCEPRVYDAANVSSDGFHPSDQGYQLMATLGFPALASGAAAAPSASCPQRSLLPAF